MLKKRILVFGANGMLGQRCLRFFNDLENCIVMGSSLEDSPVLPRIDYKQADITKREDLKKVIYDFYPDVIINTAAFTNVDAAENNRELAWKINVKSVELFAEFARVLDAHLVHISTDYVFDGNQGYYTENDNPNPIGYYAKTKLASENVLKTSGTLSSILRTNVLYGPIESGRLDFVRWVVESLKEGKQINIVTDQINNPTYLDDLVQGINKVIEFKKYDLYNIGGKEFLNRYEFTLKIANYFGLDKSLINPILTADLHQLAKRPLKSGLVTLKAETELGYRATDMEETFRLMKTELKL